MIALERTDFGDGLTINELYYQFDSKKVGKLVIIQRNLNEWPAYFHIDDVFISKQSSQPFLWYKIVKMKEKLFYLNQDHSKIEISTTCGFAQYYRAETDS